MGARASRTKATLNCSLCSLELQLSFLPYRPVKGLAEQMESAFKPSDFVRPGTHFVQLLLSPHNTHDCLLFGPNKEVRANSHLVGAKLVQLFPSIFKLKRPNANSIIFYPHLLCILLWGHTAPLWTLCFYSHHQDEYNLASLCQNLWSLLRLHP